MKFWEVFLSRKRHEKLHQPHSKGPCPPSPSSRWPSGELAFGSNLVTFRWVDPLKSDNLSADPESSSIEDATKRRAMLVTEVFVLENLGRKI